MTTPVIVTSIRHFNFVYVRLRKCCRLEIRRKGLPEELEEGFKLELRILFLVHQPPNSPASTSYIEQRLHGDVNIFIVHLVLVEDLRLGKRSAVLVVLLSI